MYALQLFDTYAPSYGLLTVGLMECVAVGWVYGKFNIKNKQTTIQFVN